MFCDCARQRSAPRVRESEAAQKQRPKKKPEIRFREPMQHFGLTR
jgi:hypothetical protein